ncbi:MULTISPECIES: dipeptidase [Halolamina]|uniref:Membrane dipeptidase n=1 Tax=Halolamina pelagica TaxID=699431 RepID=A0A1I5SFV8_9EURY|nr:MULTISPECIES: membrane dipeptidase [Halolamina]NHX37079.1 peptidase [Halolamina sp. R1-12]SFP69589.1 membrane dipeptidase [Halolamina pelagica]
MLPVIDGHNDTLLAATSDRAGGEFLREPDDPDGHLDLARAEEAGLAAGVFAMFVPNEGELDWNELPPAVDGERARRVVDEQFATLHDWADATDRFLVVRDIDALDACIDGTAVGGVPHIEGAAAVSPDLVNLEALYETGLRSLGLVWSRPNAFAHGVPFEHDATPDIGPGLTDAGFDLVEACEGMGIVVDLAHLNAAGFWDVAETVDAPLVVSHAGAHGISPSSRNLTDDQLDAIADSGGIVGCTFGTAHLRPDGQRGKDASLSTLLDHVEYFADRMGVEHVGLGADFDGASIPEAVGDVRGLRDVLAGLEARGYDRTEREAIAYGNWRRVLAAWWN